MTIKLPRLPLNWQQQPQLLERYWDIAMSQIEANINALLELPEIQAAILAAQTAADTAQTSATTANTAAAAANTAATTAQTAATNATNIATITNSGVSGVTITATDAGTNCTATISGHTRIYGDGTSVSVTGGNVTGLSYSTTYFFYYDQPSRAGGSVSYQATTDQSVAAQTGNRHLVGSVTTPAAAGGPVNGDSVRPPGIGGIR